MLTATDTGTLTTQHQLLTDLRLESTRGGGAAPHLDPSLPLWELLWTTDPGLDKETVLRSVGELLLQKAAVEV